MKHLKSLLNRITKNHPTPWKVEYLESRYPNHVSTIVDAKGENVTYIATHTGDGDIIYLNDNEMLAFVEFVNKYMED